MAKHFDKELEEFRRIMEVPSTFEEGFRWSSLFGALFVGVLMVPGAVYMGLLAGAGSVGAAAQWVTVIMLIEVAKRTHKKLNRAEIYILFFLAAGALGMPFSGLLWNQFFIRSEAAVSTGIADQLPVWFAPQAESESYDMRTFFHWDWFPVVGMVIFGTFFSQLKSIVLGYGLFRVASDIEKLPFPMAPIGASGVVAMAEDADTDKKDQESSWRWRVFSIGGALGLAFGAVYLLLPTLSGALTGTPVAIFPIPFSDFTGKTGTYLHAVATGLSWDFGNLIAGMVMPFYGMLGSFIGLIVTFVANPILYEFGVLDTWKEGHSTVQTLYANTVDFYFSFQIGIALAIAIVGFYQVYNGLQNARKEASRQGRRMMTISEAWSSTAPKGRGDIPLWAIISCYFFVTIIYIGVSMLLLAWHHNWDWGHAGLGNIFVVLLFLGFIYTPLISYVTARLEGMVGQVVQIPFLTQACMILSGYRGVACWFLPLPVANYGAMTMGYRVCELTGTKFTSKWKAQLILAPIILLSSIFFMNFLWGLDDVPSGAYPFAQRMWPLQAMSSCITFSSTLGEFSPFEQAFNWWYLGSGAIFGVMLFGTMRGVGAPIMLTYGVVRGLGQTMPHSVIPQFIGALIGRYYFQKRLKLNWRKYIPVVAAGFACGMGLIATVGIGIVFLSKAVIKLPF